MYYICTTPVCMYYVSTHTVGVRKKFLFRFRSTIVLRCERTLNYGVKPLLRSRVAYCFYGFDRGKFFERL